MATCPDRKAQRPVVLAHATREQNWGLSHFPSGGTLSQGMPVCFGLYQRQHDVTTAQHH
jgi:hypothetical protein